MQEEMGEHLAMQTEENLRAGLPAAEARRQAVLEFGAVEAIKEDYRAKRGPQFIETFPRDLRYAVRILAQIPQLYDSGRCDAGSGDRPPKSYIFRAGPHRKANP
jgi:hypothetical protein